MKSWRIYGRIYVGKKGKIVGRRYINFIKPRVNVEI